MFRFETAERVTDNGNTWKCVNCGCKKKAIPMQISAGASLKSNLILEFNNSPKLFSRKKWILLKRSVVKSMHSSPTRDTGILIMKPILGPPNVIILKPPQEEVGRHWERHGDMVGFHGLHCLSHSTWVWVESVKHKVVVVEAETVSPRTVVFGLRFKQSTRSTLYLNQPQTPNCSSNRGLSKEAMFNGDGGDVDSRSLTSV